MRPGPEGEDLLVTSLLTSNDGCPVSVPVGDCPTGSADIEQIFFANSWGEDEDISPYGHTPSDWLETFQEVEDTLLASPLESGQGLLYRGAVGGDAGGWICPDAPPSLYPLHPVFLPPAQGRRKGRRSAPEDTPRIVPERAWPSVPDCDVASMTARFGAMCNDIPGDKDRD